MNEIWKPFKHPDCPTMDGLYEISNKGRLKSLPRAIQRYSHNGSLYTAYKKERILKFRTNKKSKLLFTTLQKSIGYKKYIIKTIYIHYEVARLFVPNPNPRRYKHVTHINPKKPHHNWSDNLMWCDQSYLSLRNIELYPHLRNNLRDANIKSGYYKTSAGHFDRTKFDRPRTSVPYYVLKGNRIICNNTNKVATTGTDSLKVIEQKFNDYIKSFEYFVFAGLSNEQRMEINNLLPKTTLTGQKLKDYRKQNEKG